MPFKKIIPALFIFLMATGSAFAQKYKVKIETTLGNIEFILYDNTPQHRDNMVKLAKAHFFDSTLFHRVIPQFVIQGGDPDSKRATAGQMLGNGGLGYKIPAEILPENNHVRGAVGMARNADAMPSSACQFYIVLGKKYTEDELNNLEKQRNITIAPELRKVYTTTGGIPFLDGGYTVFGMVTKGLDLAEKIANVERDAADRPLQDVRMLKVRVKKKRKFLFF